MFKPYIGYVEVEPIQASSPLADDSKSLLEMAKIIQIRLPVDGDAYQISVGDIIFFRPHGFFELPEYEGKKRYVVNLDPDFVLGIYHPDVADKQV